MKKRVYKFGVKPFLRCTPSLFRRIGNSLFSTATFVSGFAFLSDDKKMAIWILAFGAIGKILTEFFSQDELERDYEDAEPEATDNELPTPLA